MSKKLTKEAYQKLKEKLEYLENEKTQEVAKKLKKAASFGDLSENAAYDAAKDERAALQKKIRKLKSTIQDAEVIEEEDMDKVRVGSKVTVETKNGEQVFQVVNYNEADPTEGKISSDSPIGKALIDQEEGDEVKAETPAGEMEYKIINIE